MKRRSISILVGLLVAGTGVTVAEVPTAPDAVSPLLIGATVPDVTVRDADGTALSLAEAAGKQPTILIFYRGGW